MRFLHGLVLSATDLANHLACRHLTSLNLAAASGRLKPPIFHDDRLEALRERGFQHESAYLDHLRSRGREVVELRGLGLDRSAVEQTGDAMRAGSDVIAQATLASGRWHGRADVLLRVDRPSKLGDWSYEVVDTKLSRETRAGTLLQLCLYSDLLGEVQGADCERMYVVTPRSDFVPEEYRIDDYSAFYRRVKAKLLTAVVDVETPSPTYPEPCPQCEICNWRIRCDRQRRHDDHLSLVAGIQRLQRQELEQQQIPTLEALGSLPLPLPFKPNRGSKDGYRRVREQARVQLEGRLRNQNLHELLPLEEGQGLARLPEPCPGDVFFDFEGDAFVGERGREYLFGYVTIDDEPPRYHSLWALTEPEERAAFEKFVDEMTGRLDRFPEFHIYHYSPYEPATLKRLMGHFATHEDEVDRLLRGGRFVDLLAVVRRGLRASVEGYSIKQLEAFYGFERPVDLQRANRLRFALQHALELDRLDQISQEMLDAVEGYNQDDCVSTLRLRDWLEGLRKEHVALGVQVPRPELISGEITEELGEEREKVRQLMDRLLGGVPLEREKRSAEEQAIWLLAQILDWHRREDKSVWWEYFRLRDLTEEEMLEERDAIAELRFVERVGAIKRSVIDSYAYPPQEVSIQPGGKLKASLIDGGVFGEVVAIDPTIPQIHIKKGPSRAEIHPPTVFVHDRYDARAQRDSLFRLATWVAENGIDSGGSWKAGRDLLLGMAPRRGGEGTRGPLRNQDESALEATRRLVRELDGGVLAIQGPPGSGKTFTGARMICEAVRAGKKVGVTAVSHKVIRHLLEESCVAAREEGVSLPCIQKVGEVRDPDHASIVEVTTNSAVAEALEKGEVPVFAGTAWLWARAELAESLDILFVDEAGQMSLSNVLAVSSAARNLVLLGDPQQLEQPQQGSHPEGTEVSALEHVLGRHKTMPEEQGLFLEETYRLHPDICSFTSEQFYESRLQPRPGLEKQMLVGGNTIQGSGLWYLPLLHEGNVNSCTEEVEAIQSLVDSLVQGQSVWQNSDGQRHKIGLHDILIVAPYNSQVVDLRKALPGAQVGTVDKFQGQQAPIVIYSMTTSSPEAAPRGMEFLYSSNRLNVATSRAKAACVLVGSPKLLEAECRSPRQMKLVNAFCRYVELAQVLPTGSRSEGASVI